MPAAASLKIGALPIGLAHNVTLITDVAAGAVVARGAVKPLISAGWRARDEMAAASGKSVAAA
jgi:predicted homoserine dehydrogenase-like protein